MGCRLSSGRTVAATPSIPTCLIICNVPTGFPLWVYDVSCESASYISGQTPGSSLAVLCSQLGFLPVYPEEDSVLEPFLKPSPEYPAINNPGTGQDGSRIYRGLETAERERDKETSTDIGLSFQRPWHHCSLSIEG